MEKPQGQSKRKTDHLKPWQFQPGKSGNPGGMKPGTRSLKSYAKEYLLSLPDEKKIEYMKGMDKKDIWEMAEGKPKSDLSIEGNLTISQVLDQLDGSTPSGQKLEDKQPL